MTLARDKMRALAWYAKTWVGFREEGQNKGQAVELFQKAVNGKAEGEPWCLAFVQFCTMRMDDLFDEIAQSSSGPRQKLHRTELCADLYKFTPPECRVEIPSPGSIVVWSKLVDGQPSASGHCGIVTEIYDGGVVTVEGNTGGGDQREGDCVAFKRRAKGDVPGFVRLAWLNPWEQLNE